VRRALFYGGFGIVTGAVLALEVLDTRVLSVLTWYSLAFLVISMGMFGLTVGALRVYFRSDLYAPDRLSDQLRRDATCFALLVPVSYLLLLVVPLRVAPVWTTVVLFVVFSAILALPFVPAGAVIAAALTRSRFPIGRLYAVDLLGAALGALAVPALLWILDAGTAILAVGAIAGLGAIAFSWSGESPRPARSTVLVTGALAIACLANAVTDHGLVPIWIKGEPEDREEIEFEIWNTYSRVVVSPAAVKRARLWGIGSHCPPTSIRQRLIVIDGEADTTLFETGGDLEEVRFLMCDVTNVAHYLRMTGPVAVIGTGGTRDIQSALLFGHEEVVGIEMNGDLVDLLEGPVGKATGVIGHPGVRLVRDEGRSFLTRTPESFQVIMASLTDTWAATGAGAHALGENGLYTVEAWRTFLDRLEPGGIFTVSRWYLSDEIDEIPRLLSLGVAALLDRGVTEPRRHVALVGAEFVATLLVSRDPFTPADIERLQQVADSLGFRLLATPLHTPQDPLHRQILDARSPESLDSVTLGSVLDHRAPTDDRPFFFNTIRLRNLLDLPENLGGIVEGNRMATTALVLAAFSSLALALGAILVPLVRRARPRRQGPVLWAGLGYFLVIGLAFLLVEIGFLLRLSVVLGHPVYSLLVVLPGLIAATGLGSLVSDRLPLDRSPACYAYPVAISILVAAAAWTLHETAPLVQPAVLWKRILYGLAITGLPGIFMGLAFPAGMRLARGILDEETPWLWGINGVGSVLAGSVALMISLEYGISRALAAGAVLYLLLLPLVAILRARRS
jgi:spermidine synthase